MRTLNRLKATLSASFETFVSNVENQEAVVNQAIIDIKDALGDIKIRAREAQKAIDTSVKRQNDLNQQVCKWQDFTKELHDKDPQKAKECVYKVISLKQEIELSIQNQEAFQADLKILNKDKAQVEQKLREVQSKRSRLLSRQALISSQESSQRLEGLGGVNDIFNRWENKLIKAEVMHSPLSSCAQDSEALDEVDQLFREKELNKLIETELENILKNS